MEQWYSISNIEAIDTPALAVYPDRAKENIRVLKSILPDTGRLRPHVKTHKSAEIAKMMMAEGIRKFKCATIAEAEMLGSVGAPDVLLAYQPVGPRANRLLSLVEKYPSTLFSCLVDNAGTAKHISDVFQNSHRSISVFIDLNIGMNRTGIDPGKALQLYLDCLQLGGLRFKGLHGYDGHIHDNNPEIRKQQSDKGFAMVGIIQQQILAERKEPFTIVMGGTPTFPIHAKRKDVECSPGTFIYWDQGYRNMLSDLPFLFAALVVTRVISMPSEDTLCLDLGHKAIASENPLSSRVFFLNGPDLKPVGHSEEHLVVSAGAGHSFEVGDVLYGVPFHICPTVALYDSVAVVTDHVVADKWKNLSRNRAITV